ncbi:putative E3 ubiquitin-protein ligase [Trichinella pseudospiralis]
MKKCHLGRPLAAASRRRPVSLRTCLFLIGCDASIDGAAVVSERSSSAAGGGVCGRPAGRPSDRTASVGRLVGTLRSPASVPALRLRLRARAAFSSIQKLSAAWRQTLPNTSRLEPALCQRRRQRLRRCRFVWAASFFTTPTTRVASCGREGVGRRLDEKRTTSTKRKSTVIQKKATSAEPWPDRAGQQQMVILADFLMPWRLCRKLRRRPLLPWSLVDGRCATRTLDSSSNLGVVVDDPAASVENELNRVRTSVALMLNRMNESPDEALPNCSEEECVVCLSGKASLQTFPCGHMVLCRRCFVKTIQVALDERQLPLRCIICRSRIVRLKQQFSSRCRTVNLLQHHLLQFVDPVIVNIHVKLASCFISFL